MRLDAALIAIFVPAMVTGITWLYSTVRDQALSPLGAAKLYGVLVCIFFPAAIWHFTRPLRGISSRVRWLAQ